MTVGPDQGKDQNSRDVNQSKDVKSDMKEAAKTIKDGLDQVGKMNDRK